MNNYMNLTEQSWDWYMKASSEQSGFVYEPGGQNTFPDFTLTDFAGRSVVAEVKSVPELVTDEVVQRAKEYMMQTRDIDTGNGVEFLFLDGMPFPRWYRKLIFNPKKNLIPVTGEIICVWSVPCSNQHKARANKCGIYGHTFEGNWGSVWAPRPPDVTALAVMPEDDVNIMHQVVTRALKHGDLPVYEDLGL